MFTHDQTLAEHAATLQVKADHTTVQRDFVLREHFDELFTLMGNTVDTKAQNTDVEVINSNVQDMIEQTNEISKQLAVALRFIEWFTSRGVNYEFNIGIIDKHLGGLADTVLHQRKPYQNGVKYTSAPAGDGNSFSGPRSLSPIRRHSPAGSAAASAASTASHQNARSEALDSSLIDSANTTRNDSMEASSPGGNRSHGLIHEDEILQMISEAEQFRSADGSAGAGTVGIAEFKEEDSFDESYFNSR